MKDRLLGFSIKAVFYGSMWLLALFPFEIGLAYVYNVAYVFPDAETFKTLSNSYWAMIILPPIFRLLKSGAKAILGDIWIDIQNEISLLFYRSTHGEVRQTFLARLWGIVSTMGALALIGYTIWFYVSSFLTYKTASGILMSCWAIITVAFMKLVQTPKEDDDEV